MKYPLNLAMPFLLLLLCVSPALGMGRSEGAIQKTWDFPASVKSIVIDADQQDIVVRSGGDRITGRLVGDRGSDVRVSRNEGQVSITIRSNRGWLSWGRRSSRVELQVPAGLELDLTTDSGAILVEAPTQSLKGRSASGDIEASRGGRSVDVDTTSGTIRLHGFEGEIQANAISGSILLESMKGTIRASSLSGSIDGEQLTPADGSRFSVVSGDISLALTGGLEDYRGHCESTNGDIEVGGQKAQERLDWGTRGTSMTTKTVSGNIRIR